MHSPTKVPVCRPTYLPACLAYLPCIHEDMHRMEAAGVEEGRAGNGVVRFSWAGQRQGSPKSSNPQALKPVTHLSPLYTPMGQHLNP